MVRLPVTGTGTCRFACCSCYACFSATPSLLYTCHAMLCLLMAWYTLLFMLLGLLCLLVYHTCLSRCTCVASVTLVCVPEVPVICFSATSASQWSIGSFLACWLTSLCNLACYNWSIWSIQLSVIAYWLILWLNDSIILWCWCSSITVLLLTCAVAYLSYLDLF